MTGARLVGISDPHSLGAFSEEVGDAAYWAREAVKAREKVKSLQRSEDQGVPASVRAAVSESLLEAANGRVSELEAAVQRQRKENEWLRKELAEARKVVVVKLPGGATAYIDPPTARATRR